MTRQKSNRIFLGIVTGLMAIAGTGLTVLNNISEELLQIGIAIALGTCFGMSEVTFLWGHKRFEDANKLWRKIILGVSLGFLVCAMGFAFAEELKSVLHKIETKSLVTNSAVIVESAKSSKAQTRLGSKALDTISQNKLIMNSVPFIVCYIITGLVSIVILAVSERKRQRTTTYGNQLPHNSRLQAHVQSIGFAPENAKAYRDSGNRGYSVHAEGRYQTFITDKDLSKYS